MYCDFFGLRFHPFDDPADTRFFFQTAEGEEALASMEYESHDGGGMALLLGQAGTGKSLLIRMFLQRLRAPDRSVVLTWPASEQPHLIHAAAKGFGITVPASSDPTRCLSRLRGHLSRRVGADLKAILILDQAENLTAENMAQLAALSELQSDSRGLLSILLVGQPQFRNLLDLPETARIRQRVFGDRVLPPLTAAETERYIHHRLRVAGTGETPLFEPDAARAIHEASGGIPRLINRLCNTALLAAYGAGDGRVASALAAEVCGGVPAEPTGNDVAFIDNRPLTIDHPEPRGSHQATTVSAFVEAPGPDPGSTGSDPYGPDQIPSRDAGGKTPADPPAVPDTPLAQPWSHEPHVAASTALDHGGANDAARQSGDGVGLSASGLTRAESLLDRLEKALARAERAGVTTEASLTQHQAVEKHIHTLTTGAERLIGRLAGAVQEAGQRLGDLQRQEERLVQDVTARVRAVDGDVARADAAAAEIRKQAERVDRACQEAGGVRARLASFAESVADKADEVQERLAALVSGLDASETARERLQGLLDRGLHVEKHIQAALDQSEARYHALSEAVAADQQKTEVTLTLCRKAVSETLEKTDKQVEKRRSELDELERRREQVDAAIESTATRLDETGRKLEDLQRTAQGITASARSVLQETQEVDSAVRQRNEAMRGQLERATQLAEALRVCDQDGRRTRDEVIEATTRAHDSGQSVTAQLEQLTGRHAEAGAVTAELARLVGVARQLHEGIQAGIDHADSKLGRIRNEQQAAERTGATLVQENQRGAELVETLERATRTAEQSRAASAGQLRTLEGARCANEEIIPKLQQLVQAARETDERLQADLAGADARASRLDACRPVAEKLLDALAAATESGTALTRELGEKTQSAGQTMAAGIRHVEQVCDQIRDLSTAAEAHAGRLEGGNERAGELVKQLDVAAEAASSIRHVVDRAIEVNERLAGVVAEATENRAALETHTAAADTRIDAARRLQDETEECRNLLAAQVTDAQHLMETCEPVLREVSRRMEETQQRISRMTATAQGVEAELERISAKPAEILAGAQTQAAQLENVCAAVRKVFAALSKASLEARQRTREAQDTGREAGERLERLVGETQRASATMHEWVAEALRVQSRLERTLQQAPSIDQTHPAADLLNMSNLAPVGSDPPVAADSPSAPQVAPPKPPPQAAPPKPAPLPPRRVPLAAGPPVPDSEDQSAIRTATVRERDRRTASAKRAADRDSVPQPPRSDSVPRPSGSDSAQQAASAKRAAQANRAEKIAQLLEEARRATTGAS